MDQLLTNLPDKVTYRMWQKVDTGNGKLKMKVVDREEDKDTLKGGLIKQIMSFEQHVHRVREQYQQVRLLKENMSDTEIAIQMDFAENFSCRSLNEVQTAYWNQTMVTLHPAVAYYRENGELKHQSYVVVSDEMSHSSSTVCAFLDRLIPEVKLLKPDLTFIHYWTDSPSSQYNNKYIFHTLANHQNLYNVGARWNYFEVGHGKGPCDGLGGTAKRMADMAIRQGNVQIQNTKEFYEWASASSMTAKFLYVNTEETKRKQNEMNFIKTKPVKGTMKLHAVGFDGIDTIMTRETSCYCAICINGSYCDSWKREEFKCITDQQIEEQCLPAITVEDTHDGDDMMLHTEDHVREATSMNDIGIGTVVAVVYDNKWYIGEVDDIDEADHDMEINFMEKSKEMFKWPRSRDSVWCNYSDVLCSIKTLMPSGKSKRLYKLDSNEKDKIEALFCARI